MTIYAAVDENDIVVVQLGLPDSDGMGPPEPPPDGPYTYHQISAYITGRPNEHLLKWNGGATQWVDSRTLEPARTAALDKPRADINAVVWDAVGNLTEEYKSAEADARAYKAAGYAGTVPPSVDCFAQHNPTGVIQTGQWAADDIIARADAFASAKLTMREQRFASQSAMRAATTLADLDTAVAGWNSFITSLRTQLGLTT